MEQFDVFWKLLEKLLGNDCDGKHFLESLDYSKWTQARACFYQLPNTFLCTAQKIKFFIKDFFSKCDQIRGKLQIWSHLLKKSLMESFIFLCSDGCFQTLNRNALLWIITLFGANTPNSSKICQKVGAFSY